MKSPVTIVGGGPGGAATAMFLLKEGITPLIVERERFPRYHVGESMTGEAGALLRGLGFGPEMYKRDYPAKQGVRVYGNSKDGSWFVPVAARDENRNLSPVETWQVRRSDFDKMMLDEAISRGAGLLPGKALKPVVSDDGAVTGVTVEMADGRTQTIESEVLIDCSGQATWLANRGGVTGPKYVGAYDKQIAVFSQVANTIRDDGSSRVHHPDNTIILYKSKFHWAWLIPLDDDVVSVGIVIPSAYFLDKKESKQDFLLRELRELHPELSRRVPDTALVEDVHVIPNYSYQVKNFTGKGFICVGDAHRFVDPIFSFGLMASMVEGQYAASAVRRYLEGENRDSERPFAAHEIFCESGIDILEDTIDSFWEKPLAFAYCVNSRFPEHVIDIFAGRIYDNQPSPAVNWFRRLMEREGQRERSYETNDLYSIPIGSRYHPERAAIWDCSGDEVESTEEWMRPD